MFVPLWAIIVILFVGWRVLAIRFQQCMEDAEQRGRNKAFERFYREYSERALSIQMSALAQLLERRSADA